MNPLLQVRQRGGGRLDNDLAFASFLHRTFPTVGRLHQLRHTDARPQLLADERFGERVRIAVDWEGGQDKDGVSHLRHP